MIIFAKSNRNLYLIYLHVVFKHGVFILGCPRKNHHRNLNKKGVLFGLSLKTFLRKLNSEDGPRLLAMYTFQKVHRLERLCGKTPIDFGIFFRFN